MARIFVNGGTGYIGRPFIQALLARGHEVTAVTRPGSAGKLPAGCRPLVADALDAATYRDFLTPEHTFVQLVGVPHPSPAKARQFVDIDERSAREAIAAASARGVRHFVYVSVAHPAPVMKAYIEARSRCEERILAARLRATILRPWYVLGPGHRWPVVLIPFYKLAERIPSLAAGARRLGLVRLDEMVEALARAVEEPPNRVRILEAADIREGARNRMRRAAV